MKTALVVAAHPDDEILGCGGIMAKYRESVDFHVLVLTRGAATRYDAGMEARLCAGADEAGAAVGAREVVVEDLPNQELDRVPLIEVTRVIERHIARLSPDALFIHNGSDLNRDHRVAAEACLVASRPIPGQTVRSVYAYFVASSTEYNHLKGENLFVPNVYVDIADHLDVKIEAMRRYPSEMRPYPHPRSAEALRIYANFWGLAAGLEFAEPFQLIRRLGGL